MKHLAILAAALAAVCLPAVPAAAADQTAAQIFPVSCQGQPGAEDGRLSDASRSTRLSAADGRVEFGLEQPAAGVYLEWRVLPDSWTLTADEVQQGPAFQHAFVELEAPSDQVTLEWQGQGELCDVYFFSAGTLPDWVQAWQPPCEKADLLVLPTHADDEHLWFGGVLPYYAGEKDLAVQVAYMVSHDGEPYRRQELLDGLWKVGVENYPILPDFPDIYSESLEHARTVYDEDAVIGYQVELIRRFRPDVIVGHDINGEYGHGGHRLNTDALMQAVELAADGAACPDSLAWGVWDTPKTYLHLYPENQIVMDWDQPLERFGGKTAAEMAAEGYACHASQQGYWFSVKQSGPYDCRKFGLWRSTVGPDTGADMLQNLPQPTPSPSPSPSPSPTPAPSPSPAPRQPEEQKSHWAAAAAAAAGLLALAAVWKIGKNAARRKKRRGPKKR